MAKTNWKCNFCGQEEGVVNGVCPVCGPSQTTPVSDEAKKEAGVDAESIALAAEANAEEEKKAEEAALRNEESIKAGEGTTIDTSTLLPKEEE